MATNNQTVEPPDVQNWWARKSDNVTIEPQFKGFRTHFVVHGPEADNQFCCLYVVHTQDGRKMEDLIVVAESILQQGYYTGTNHQMALMTFMEENNLPRGSTFHYIVGFWLDKTERKIRSCANYHFQKTRQVTAEMEEQISQLVFPVIEFYFDTETTYCCGITKKNLNCKRLISIGRYCHWHEPY
eukprot:gene14310-15830_t